MNVCPVCSSAKLSSVVEIKDVPVYCNVLWSTHNEALNAHTGEIHLCFCQECGHLFNAAFEPNLMEYSTDYENSLHYSPRFQEYAETLAQELINRHGLKEKKVVEIACGKGDFLRLLCRFGNNQGLGFDPSYEPERHIELHDVRVEILAKYFGADPLPWSPDLVCCRHALEHIHYPTDFIKGIRGVIGKTSSSELFFEVPNSLYTLRDLGIWDLIYEHCSYFWAGSLHRCFELAGFDMTEVWEAFDGQFLCIDTSTAKSEMNRSLDRSPNFSEMKDWIARFEDTYLQKITFWRERLNSAQKNRKRVVVWGAGSKGISFLNIIKEAGEINFVVDLNPHKQGRFVPRTGQLVISPESLSEYRPDIVVLMNGIYRDEVLGLLHRLNLEAELLVA